MSSIAVAHLDTNHNVVYFLLLYHLQPISAFSLYHLRVFCDITFDDLVPCDSEYERCTEYHEHMAPSCLFLSFQIWLSILPDGVFPIPL